MQLEKACEQGAHVELIRANWFDMQEIQILVEEQEKQLFINEEHKVHKLFIRKDYWSQRVHLES